MDECIAEHTDWCLHAVGEKAKLNQQLLDLADGTFGDLHLDGQTSMESNRPL
jgi:hypothetical protein